MMKHCGPDVIQVSQKSKDTSPLFIVPNFNLIIISARNKQRLLIMETYSSNGSVVFIEFVEQGAHAVIPQLDNAIMQTVIYLQIQKIYIRHAIFIDSIFLYNIYTKNTKNILNN